MIIAPELHDAENVLHMTALALEYERQYGDSGRYVHISDFLDKSVIDRLFGGPRSGLQEETFNSRFVHACIGGDDGGDATLIGLDAL